MKNEIAIMGNTNAIAPSVTDIKAKMLKMHEVVSVLTPIEKRIIEAGSKKLIKDLNVTEMEAGVTALTPIITSDIGIKNVGQFVVKRFSEILRTYFGGLTLREVRLAFELCAVGELDEFLPLDSKGNPDKAHYQSFDTMYISKVLNAYKKRKREADYKAYIALPAPKQEMTQETKYFYSRVAKEKIIAIFLQYKYKGILPWDNINEFLIYKKLEAIGYAEPIEIIQADMKAGVARLIRKAQMGVINEFIGECIRHLQTKHSDVPREALIIAKQRAIKQSFDRIINEEIQLVDLILNLE